MDTNTNAAVGPLFAVLCNAIAASSGIAVAPHRGRVDVTVPAGRRRTRALPASLLNVTTAEPALIEALGRLVALSSTAQAKVLGPLVTKELHYRLLMAPVGGMLRRLALHDPQASAVARAIAVIRRDCRTDLAVPELARQVGMSASSFHRHFKAVTSSTPLQYQKDLRLLEARRLITHHGTGITAAALDVGYESPSQFTREYSRKFGTAPSRDA